MSWAVWALPGRAEQALRLDPTSSAAAPGLVEAQGRLDGCQPCRALWLITALTSVFGGAGALAAHLQPRTLSRMGFEQTL